MFVGGHCFYRNLHRNVNADTPILSVLQWNNKRKIEVVEMKKIICLILVIALCVPLFGCGKSEAVKAAEEAINNIGEVTLDSEAAILNAEKLYNILTDTEKAEVSNRLALVDAREAFEKLQEEQAEAQKKVIYTNAKDAFEKLNLVASLCIDGMDDIYSAWHFGIYTADDCTSSNIYTKLADVTSFSSTELKTAAAQWSGMSADTMGYLLPDDWQYCLQTVKTAIEIRGDYETIKAELESAQAIMQELTTVYDDYTYYPELKKYYASVSSYVEFFLSPSGSFNQLSTTVENYETAIRTYQSDLGFLFSK
jgi:hypothetical protein